MEDPEQAVLRQLREDDKPTLGGMITGFLITLVAIPILFMATCVPAVMVGKAVNWTVAIVLWIAASLGFGIWIAIKTNNPGTRLAIILTAIGGLGFAAWTYLPQLLPGIAWPWH